MPCLHQIPFLYNNLAKEGDRSHRYQEKAAPHHAWRDSPTKSSTHRLYTKSNEGGQGLVSVITITKDETTKIQEYIRTIAPNDDLLSECLRQ